MKKKIDPTQPKFVSSVPPSSQDSAVWFQQAVNLQNQGRFAEARASYEKCLALDPQHVVAHNNLGNVYFDLGLSELARASFLKAIALDPANTLPYYNLGHVQQCLGLDEDALASYSQGIALGADFPEIYLNCGVVLLNCRQPETAIQCFQKAIELRPAYATAYNNLGTALLDLGHHAEAAECFQVAAQLDASDANAFNNLGIALSELKQFDTAASAYRQAFQLNPDLGHAAGQAWFCSRWACDWHRIAEDSDLLYALVARGVAVPPFILLALGNPLPVPTGEFLRAGTALYAAKKFPELAQPALCATDTPAAHGPLRLGYLSSDFYEHATMHLLKGVLAAHDRHRFTLFAYSDGKQHDETTRAVAAHFEAFRDISQMSARDAALTIAADHLDILIDLKGFTANFRQQITALRPAPLIVNWLGYPGTLGHPRLADYLIGDAIVTPPEHAAAYSETLALMPHCYQPNDRQRQIGNKPDRSAAGLPENGFVFCSFNQSYKFDPDTFSIWCALLHAVPGSVLWLLQPNAAALANLQREAQARGIAPERIIFAAQQPQKAHLGRLQLADLALDTFPVTSHTTASDALWAGVPLITCRADHFVSRVAASLLHTLGIPELIAENRDDYYLKAKALAEDPGKLAKIRQQLSEARLTSPLFDTPRFTRNLEALLMRMQAQQRQGKREIIVLDEAAAG